MHTILRGGKRSGTKNVRVTLAARCTEIGTLELFCVGKDGNNRWRLEFNVRDIVYTTSTGAGDPKLSTGDVLKVQTKEGLEVGLALAVRLGFSA